MGWIEPAVKREFRRAVKRPSVDSMGLEVGDERDRKAGVWCFGSRLSVRALVKRYVCASGFCLRSEVRGELKKVVRRDAGGEVGAG